MLEDFCVGLEKKTSRLSYYRFFFLVTAFFFTTSNAIKFVAPDLIKLPCFSVDVSLRKLSPKSTGHW